MTDTFTLHQSPHRHYRVSRDGGKPNWNGADKRRIVSVTSALDGGQDRLTNWAAKQGVAAGEMVARRWLGADDVLDNRSVLAFSEMAALMPEHPHTYRDHKAALGTALHEYLAHRLAREAGFSAWKRPAPMPGGFPFGLRAAVDGFLDEERPIVVCDRYGPRVERAVGDYERAVAGTYDGQVIASGTRRLAAGLHRIDAKSSNMLQPKHWAQTAEYEREAVLCGEEPSAWLTILHFTPMGDCFPYSIATGSPEHRMAQGVFDAALTIHRSTPQLAKLLVNHNEED